MARHVGWLELGFDRTYFDAELARRGFSVEHHSVADIDAYGNPIVATVPD